MRYYIGLRGLERHVIVDSAGTHAYHSGDSPDPRAQRAAVRRGFDLSRIRARGVEVQDFERFDLILAMDRDNLRGLTRRCPDEHRDKLQLLMQYARRSRAEEIPDPYYGGDAGFERVLDMIEDAVQGVLDHVAAELRRDA